MQSNPDTTFGATAADRRWPAAYARVATVTVMVLGIGLRFLFLDADPNYYNWIGYITDEGRWTEHARGLAVFGQIPAPTLDDLHLFVAPLFELTAYIIFALTDVSLLTSRMISAVSGCLVLVSFWILLRRHTTSEALFLGIVPLALQVDLVTLSRLAVPEMASIALQFFLFFAVTRGNPSWLRYVVCGLSSLLVLGMKITAAPAVAIFAFLILLRSLRSPRNTEHRWAPFLLFVAGGIGPVIVLATGLLSSHPQLLGQSQSGFANLWRFVNPSSMFGVISFPFESALSPELNLWGLAFWYALIGWRASSAVDTQPRRYFLASALWCTAYLGIMLALDYFPDRYKVHIFVPMCITVVVGVSLLQRAGLRNAELAFTRDGGLRRLAGLAFLSLPTAALLSPLLEVALGLFGVEPFRLRAKVMAVVISVLALLPVLEWRRRREKPLTFFMLFPVAATLAWFVMQRSGLSAATFWASPDFVAPFSTSLIVLVVAALCVAGTVESRRPAHTISLPAGIVAGATGYTVLALLQLAPGYLSPHYTIRDTSRQLGALLDGFSGTVATSKGDSLFLENTLRYRGVSPEFHSDRPHVLVIVFRFADPQNLLATEYCRIGEYPLYVAPAYYRANPTLTPTSRLGETAYVYRKRVSSQCRDSADSGSRTSTSQHSLVRLMNHGALPAMRLVGGAGVPSQLRRAVWSPLHLLNDPRGGLSCGCISLLSTLKTRPRVAAAPA